MSLVRIALLVAAALTVVGAVGWRMRLRAARRGMSDRLTGLHSRSLFESRVEHAQLRAKRHSYWVGVLTIDVDELATVNNTMGRDCGDQLLRDIAGKLKELARDEDTVARLSADGFGILLEQIDNPTGAARAARRILDEFQKPLTIDGRAVVSSVSIGISVDQGGTQSGETLLREAGIALMRAKGRGKGRFETFEPPMGVEAMARLTLEAELHQAVTGNEVLVHYQPIVDLGTGQVIGAEALARWAHPERGLLLPRDFIAVAETSGAIVPMGRAILEEACRTAVHFGRVGDGCPDFQISVNVSSRQFRDSEQLLEDVRHALRSSGLPAERLTLEITESSLLDDLDAAVAVVRRLRGLGVNVALDDFGTGYSSLAYVKKIPVSGLKIDRSFIWDLEEPATAAIVKAILDIAAQLDIDVTAEGAESDDHLSRLRQLGCRQVQGYVYSAALPEAAFIRLLMRAVPRQRTDSPPVDDLVAETPPESATA